VSSSGARQAPAPYDLTTMHCCLADREAMGWALRDVVEAGNHDLLGAESTQIRSNILSLRASLATLYDFHAQPVPFFYVHLITMISGIYLPLFAYGVAIDVELTSSEDAFTQFVAHVVGCVRPGLRNRRTTVDSCSVDKILLADVTMRLILCTDLQQRALLWPS
jgi:hypothetical protein